jgi:hypothetical protein
MRHSVIFRSWLALWLQQRRRKRAAGDLGTPPAPVIVAAWYSWDDTETGWVDNYLSITFAQGTVPVATFEIWESDSNHDWHLIETIASAGVVDPYHHARVAEDNDVFHYKVRYVNGVVIGPFSEDCALTVDPHP